MADVVWSKKALRHIDRITAYILQFDPAAAGTMRARLIDLGNSLQDFPHRGRPAPRGKRELVTAPPYILTYHVKDGVAYILSIRHGARRPLD